MPASKVRPPKKVPKRAISRPDIKPVSELGLEFASMGIYSWPGAGKTPFFGSGGPEVLILDCDINGITSAAAEGSEAMGRKVRDYDDMEEVYQWLRHGGTDEFEWVCLDSITLFQDATLIDDILDEAHMNNPANQDPDVPSQREYLKSQSRIGRYVRQFVDLPINVAFAFHVTAQTTPDDRTLYAPLLQGGKNNDFSTKIQGYLNILGYLYTTERKGGVYTTHIRFRENEEYIAKDKFHALPAVMDNPSLPEIDRLIAKSRFKKSKSSKKKKK